MMAAVEPIDLTSVRHELLQRPKTGAFTNTPFKGASQTRLNVDWAVRMLSADQEIRSSLLAMRARCRLLANNNDYAGRFLYKAEENVIGPNGIGLEMDLDPATVPGAEQLNRQIEDAWSYWCENVDVDGRKSHVDFAKLWIRTKLQDGEAFVRRVKGYPYNDCRYALQFIDADMIDVNYQRRQAIDANGMVVNDIRMGVEIDEWRRPLYYYTFLGHPSEMAATRRVRIPAAEIDHAYVFKRINQTRGIPWMSSAMTRMNMLGGYEEAELVAARLGACKMAALVSKTGDEYKGRPSQEKKGAFEMDVQPGTIDQMPEGWDIKTIDWNHPNAALPDFVKAMLRGVAMGVNISYATLTGDLREVNFSSLRDGKLDEREGWRLLQTFAVDHHYKPMFKDWLVMAVTSGQLQIPSKLPLALIERAAVWTPRGWDWVDPKKDVDADIASIRSGQNTLKDSAAKRGRDWRDIIDQRAAEIAYAKERGVPIDLTTSGAGGVEGATQNEEGATGGQP
jgi:lambda family phage portal protein